MHIRDHIYGNHLQVHGQVPNPQIHPPPGDPHVYYQDEPLPDGGHFYCNVRYSNHNYNLPIPRFPPPQLNIIPPSPIDSGQIPSGVYSYTTNSPVHITMPFANQTAITPTKSKSRASLPCPGASCKGTMAKTCERSLCRACCLKSGGCNKLPTHKKDTIVQAHNDITVRYTTSYIDVLTPTLVHDSGKKIWSGIRICRANDTHVCQ